MRIPRPSARSEARWITGPSARGSENGKPSSITSAPASTAALCELRRLRLADEVDHQRLSSRDLRPSVERGQRLREILVAATREADGDVVGVEALDDCERVRRLERGNDALGA